MGMAPTPFDCDCQSSSLTAPSLQRRTNHTMTAKTVVSLFVRAVVVLVLAVGISATSTPAHVTAGFAPISTRTRRPNSLGPRYHQQQCSNRWSSIGWTRNCAPATTTTTAAAAGMLGRLHHVTEIVRMAAKPSFLLPTCSSPQHAMRLALASGLGGLVAQILLTLIGYYYFCTNSTVSQQQWRRANNTSAANETTITLATNNTKETDIHFAGNTAHSVIALLFMIVVSILGSKGWRESCSSNALLVSNHITTNRAAATIVSPLSILLDPSSDSSRWLASVIFGMMLMWDIPTSLFIPKLRRQTDVLIHHAVMAATAGAAAVWLPMRYVFFYFGVAEISSIPLIVYNALAEWMTARREQQDLEGDDKMATSSAGLSATRRHNQRIGAVQTTAQILTVVSFTWIRVIVFPMVTFCQFLPDAWTAIQHNQRRAGPEVALLQPAQVFGLHFAAVASMGFTILQLFWFVNQIVRPSLVSFQHKRKQTIA